MKKIFLVLVGAMMYCATQAQLLAEKEPAIVYYSPKTVLTLDFTYTVETQVRGPFANYAESMLNIKDAVKENKTLYSIKDVRIGTTTLVDYARPHTVATDTDFPMLLSINEKGLLTGYNIKPDEKKAPSDKFDSDKKQGSKPHHCPHEVAPCNEEVAGATTVPAQARAAAKQIFHIRETRTYLLNGEVEHAPADGKAMELVLEELDKQESALTEMFTGKKQTRREHKIVRIEPSDEGKLLFFSDENGFTAGDNIDADTIEVRMACQKQTIRPTEGKKKKTPKLTQIVYNIPGNCQVNVLYKGHQLADRAVPVAQFGTDVALPLKMFMRYELPVIVFSEKTGNIVSISK